MDRHSLVLIGWFGGSLVSSCAHLNRELWVWCKWWCVHGLNVEVEADWRGVSWHPSDGL